MASAVCNGCGVNVPIAGGIAAIWSFEPEKTRGMTLTFEDDSEHFLCFECIDQLPDYPTSSDVDALDSDSAP